MANSLWTSFVANNSGDAVLVSSSVDGVHWTNNTDINQSSKFGPSVAVFNNRLYVAFIANNSGNQILVCSSADGVNWTNNVDINQSSKFGPSLAVFNDRLYIAFIANNNLNQVLVCSTADGVNWTNNIDINQSSKFAPSLAAFGGKLYVAFIADNNDNQVLVCSSADGVHWSNNTDINQSSKSAPALGVFNNRLNVAFIANNSQNQVLVCSSADGVTWTGNTDIEQSSQLGPSLVEASLPSPVPAPGSGLGSNSNYILYDACNALVGLTVIIDVTEDIVCQSASGPTAGFGFQLNAYSPKNETSAWQQYVVALFGSELIGAVDNWPLSGNNIINDFFNLAAMPSAKIPAGYQIKIALQNDMKNNISGATYVVTDNQGHTQANTTVTLTSLSGVSTADLAPIIAFELNLVGPVNGESAVLSSGAGTISYQATNVMTALSSEPSCAESGYITAETANSVYTTLPSSPSTNFLQSFSVTSEALMIRKQGKIRPGFIVPPGVKY